MSKNTTSVEENEIVDYSLLLDEIITNGFADKVAFFHPSLVMDYDIEKSIHGDMYRYKTSIMDEQSKEEFNLCILSDYEEMSKVISWCSDEGFDKLISQYAGKEVIVIGDDFEHEFSGFVVGVKDGDDSMLIIKDQNDDAFDVNINDISIVSN